MHRTPPQARPFSRWLLLAAMTLPLQAATAQEPAVKPRQFAPGVLTVISPEVEPEETVSVHPVVELRSNPTLPWKSEVIPQSRTLYERAETARFDRVIWNLEFSFKPLRLIWVDVPQPTGKVERKLIWYLVYAVRNTGQGMAPAEGDQGLPVAKPVEVGPVRFLPQFVLQGYEEANGRKLSRAYRDRVIPAAVEPIRRRETPGRELLTSIQMAQQPIPVSTEADPRQVWGVAMWEDVDPNLDFFSVFVRGLTNAYRWEDPDGAFEPGDPPGTGRRFVSKTLQLNFWRPGDRFMQHESEVRFGVAPGKAILYGEGVTDGLAHRWVYR